MKNFLKISLICLLLSACLRGENNSVDQVLNQQKSHFNSVSKSASLNDAAKGSVNTLAVSLEKLPETTDAATLAASSEIIATELFSLVTKAGFTSRPAITELINQYREITTAKGVISPPAVKLLTARTYTALSSELETTKFNL